MLVLDASMVLCGDQSVEKTMRIDLYVLIEDEINIIHLSIYVLNRYIYIYISNIVSIALLSEEARIANNLMVFTANI